MLLAHQGHWVPAIARHLQLTAITVRTWLKRFNTVGLAALTDKPRSGRPATDTPQQGAAVIATALTPPEHLGLPFASWTLDRIEAYVNAQKGSATSGARLMSCCSPQASAGARQKPGLAYGSIPSSPKKGAH